MYYKIYQEFNNLKGIISIVVMIFMTTFTYGDQLEDQARALISDHQAEITQFSQDHASEINSLRNLLASFMSGGQGQTNALSISRDMVWEVIQKDYQEIVSNASLSNVTVDKNLHFSLVLTIGINDQSETIQKVLLRSLVSSIVKTVSVE